MVEWVVEKGTEGAEAAPFFPAAVPPTACRLPFTCLLMTFE